MRRKEGLGGEPQTGPASAPSGVLTALRQAPLGVAIFDRQMRYLAASSQFLTDQGLPGDTPLVGRLHYDVFPEVPQRWRETHARVLAEGVELQHDADPYVRPDGQIDWIRWSVAPWRTDGGEIGGLVLYTEVVTRAVEAHLKLEAAEAKYRAIFDHAALGVALVSPDGRFLEVNDRFCAIIHYDREELKELTFQEITHPDDLAPDLALAEALLSGEIERFQMEKRYLTKSGGTLWANLTVALITKESAPDYFVSVIEDISSRKAAEATQQHHQDQMRLLINELNHRVKNTLATVQSMAAQTMRSESDPRAAYDALESRLLGLSEVHDVLTRERWHGAALQEVAERALRPFSDTASGRVRLRGPRVWLQPGAALAMALVFHELATNAVKYGALSNDRGRVDLTWTLGDGDLMRMTWGESGGPRVSPPTRRGFGSRLIERGLKGELRGSAEMTYEPAGFRCAMEARLPQTPDGPGMYAEL